MTQNKKKLSSDLNLTPTNCPYILSRVFKIKFEQLLEDVTKKHVLGRVLACKF